MERSKQKKKIMGNRGEDKKEREIEIKTESAREKER